MIIDFYDDNGELFRKKVGDMPVPDFIKNACDLANVLNTCSEDDFAALIPKETGVLRKFATVDAGNTALSVVYFLENAEELDPGIRKEAAKRLVSACTDFKLSMPDHLLDLANNTPEVELFPEPGIPKTADGYKAAEKEFIKSINQITPDNRRKKAVELNKLASDNNISPHPIIRDYASDSYNPDMSVLIWARKNLANDRIMKTAYDCLFEKRALLKPPEFAEALYNLDKRAQITYHYDSAIPDPYLSVLKAPSVSERAIHGVNVDGIVGGVKRIDKIAGFDPGFTSALKEQPFDVLNSLSQEDFGFVVDVLKAQGIQ